MSHDALRGIAKGMVAIGLAGLAVAGAGAIAVDPRSGVLAAGFAPLAVLGAILWRAA